MIDPSARIEAGATIGNDVIDRSLLHRSAPHVRIGDGCRLVAHVNLTGHTTIGPRTVIHPFASLGSPPQSFSYRGGPTTLVVGADCDIRENVTMNTGTEEDGGGTAGRRPLLFHGRLHVAHDCKVGNQVIFANNMLLGGHVTIGDNVVFGGGVAVRQFVRIGEGAMIVGLSGVRADVIPFGMAHGPLADLIGLNVIGMRRRGLSKADIQRVRSAYQALFFGEGEFRARIDQVAAEYGADPLVNKIIEFIRAGKRPLTMASSATGGRGRMSAVPAVSGEGPLAHHLRGWQPSAGGGGQGYEIRAVGRAVSAARGRGGQRRSSGFRITGFISAKSGKFMRLARAAGCRDVVFIGSLVRPSLWQLRPDLKGLSVLPRVIAAYRGGDNHLLSGMGKLLEHDGFPPARRP